MTRKSLVSGPPNDVVRHEQPKRDSEVKTIPGLALPSRCRIVEYRGLASETHGGQDWHPAVITRVHASDPFAAVNLKVLFDEGPIETRTAIEHESKRALRAWRWPPRV